MAASLSRPSNSSFRSACFSNCEVQMQEESSEEDELHINRQLMVMNLTSHLPSSDDCLRPVSE